MGGSISSMNSTARILWTILHVGGSKWMYCPNILNLLQTGFSFFLIWVVKKWKLKRVSFLCLLKLLSIQTAIRTTITVLAHTLRVLPFFCNAGWLAGCLAGWLSGWLDGWLDGWLACTCFEARLFRWGVCWQLRIFLASPYIYSIDWPIRSQHSHCPGRPIRH